MQKKQYSLQECLLQEEIASVQVNLNLTKDQDDYIISLHKEGITQYPISKYNPIRDAKKSIAEGIINKEQINIIIGLGGGYIVEEIISLIGKEAHIIIFEPNEESALEQINKRGLQDILNLDNVVLFTGYDFVKYSNTLLSYIEIIDINNIQLIITPKYEKFYPQYIKSVTTCIENVLRNVIINDNTAKKYYFMHLQNCLKNTRAIQNSYDIKQHKNKYSNIPALIVSAGPSLSKNIKLAKNFKGIIFAMGRVLDALLENDVKPDFLVAIDPTDLSAETYKNSLQNEYPLITTCIANPKVIKNNKGPQYFLKNDSNVSEIIEPDVISFQTGGSVANTMCYLAYYMGCNPIVFIGQDLAYSNGQLHDNNAGGIIDDVAKPQMYVEGYYGGKVETDYGMNVFLQGFQHFIKEYSNRLYINATEGGAHIKGTTRKPFSEVIKEYDNIIIPTVLHRQRENKIDLFKNISNALEELKSTKIWAEKALQLCNEILEATSFDGKNVQVVRSIMKDIYKIIDNNILLSKGLQIIDPLICNQNRYMDDTYKVPIKETINEECTRIALNLKESFVNIINSVTTVLENINLCLGEEDDFTNRDLTDGI